MRRRRNIGGGVQAAPLRTKTQFSVNRCPFPKDCTPGIRALLLSKSQNYMATLEQREELHRTIWAMADELRGAVGGWEFKA